MGLALWLFAADEVRPRARRFVTNLTESFALKAMSAGTEVNEPRDSTLESKAPLFRTRARRSGVVPGTARAARPVRAAIVLWHVTLLQELDGTCWFPIDDGPLRTASNVPCQDSGLTPTVWGGEPGRLSQDISITAPRHVAAPAFVTRCACEWWSGLRSRASCGPPAAALHDKTGVKRESSSPRDKTIFPRDGDSGTDAPNVCRPDVLRVGN